MAKSEKIKLEIGRLTAEASKIQGALQEKTVLAASHYAQAQNGISQFLQHEQAEIKNTKQEQVRAAKEAFTKKFESLQTVIKAKTGFTFVPWGDSLWPSLNVENEKERPEHNLTRLGAFAVKGQNGELPMPAMFSILGGKNFLLRAEGSGRQKARAILRSVAIRLLASLPPGKLRFTFIDPVELGSTAAGLVGALPDFLTGGLAWHEEQDIQEQLSLIQTRIAAIKTKYLGIKFSSIEEYNSHAGTIEEPYWLIVVSDCPVRFRDDALQKLISIAKNGPQAGIYLAVMLDEQEKKCTDYLISEIAQTANHIVCPDHNDPVSFDDPDFIGLEFQLDSPPDAALIVASTPFFRHFCPCDLNNTYAATF
jgi:hypothetical protein